MRCVTACGISHRFRWLFPTQGQVAYALLTRAPLYLRPEGHVLVRLACMKPAASVRPEPGSNSPLLEILNFVVSTFSTLFLTII